MIIARRCLAWPVLLGAVVLVAGCGHTVAGVVVARKDAHRLEYRKQVKLVFVNNTKGRKAVSMSVAGGRFRNVGVARGRGGEVHEELLLDPQFLPVEVDWKSGKYRGSFVITRRTPEVRVVNIGHRGEPILHGRDDRRRPRGRGDEEWDDD